MSPISEALWKSEFDLPMPEGTTYQQFVYKRELKWVGEAIRDKLKEVKVLKNMSLSPNQEMLSYIADQEKQLGELYVQKRQLETKGIEDVR